MAATSRSSAPGNVKRRRRPLLPPLPLATAPEELPPDGGGVVRERMGDVVDGDSDGDSGLGVVELLGSGGGERKKSHMIQVILGADRTATCTICVYVCVLDFGKSEAGDTAFAVGTSSGTWGNFPKGWLPIRSTGLATAACVVPLLLLPGVVFTRLLLNRLVPPPPNNP